MLPQAINGYVIDVAERQQCPIDFVAVSSICSLATLLGRKAIICPKQKDDWEITPNLWGALIGRPSAMKSPAMKAALYPLYELEKKAAKDYEEAHEEFLLDKEFSEINKENIKQQAKKLLKESKTEDAKKTLSDALFNKKPPKRSRIIVNDTTVEQLGVLLNENPNGLVLIRDELSGWLSKISKEEYQQDRSFFIECFDGDGHYTYDRISRDHIEIENLTLSLIGGIQPAKIGRLISETLKGIGNDGLLQRLQLAVWPNDKGKWKWIDREPNKEAYNQYQRIFMNFHNLNTEKLCFRFTKKAQLLFTEWMIQNQLFASSDSIHPAFESHLLKMPKTIASLALIFELVIRLSFNANLEFPNNSEYIVDEDAITLALRWAKYLESHANRIYSFATNQSLDGARLILARINKLENTFSLRDIARKQWIGLTEEHVIQESLDYLVDYRHLTIREVETTNQRGRPTTRYHKHAIYVSKSDDDITN